MKTKLLALLITLFICVSLFTACADNDNTQQSQTESSAESADASSAESIDTSSAESADASSAESADVSSAESADASSAESVGESSVQGTSEENSQDASSVSEVSQTVYTIDRNATYPPVSKEYKIDADFNMETADNKHWANYHSIDMQFMRRIVSTANDSLWMMIDKTDYACIGAYIDYYCITEEQYIAALEAEMNRLKMPYEEYRNVNFPMCEYKAWFSDDYENAEEFIYDGYVAPEISSVRHRFEGDSAHTNLYYTIDYRLIEYVTPEEFKKFEDAYAGTENFNIVYFIEYFDITKEEYVEAIETYTNVVAGFYISYPYYTDALYGDAATRDLYFVRHPVNG